MIKLEGTVLNVFTQQGGTNKKGEAFEDRDKVQILGAMELPNGDVKMSFLHYQSKIIVILSTFKSKNFYCCWSNGKRT